MRAIRVSVWGSTEDGASLGGDQLTARRGSEGDDAVAGLVHVSGDVQLRPRQPTGFGHRGPGPAVEGGDVGFPPPQHGRRLLALRYIFGPGGDHPIERFLPVPPGGYPVVFGVPVHGLLDVAGA